MSQPSMIFSTNVEVCTDQQKAEEIAWKRAISFFGDKKGDLKMITSFATDSSVVSFGQHLMDVSFDFEFKEFHD